jgi:monofunctional biosynthetic peptidoglycan transglycosylase
MAGKSGAKPRPPRPRVKPSAKPKPQWLRKIILALVVIGFIVPVSLTLIYRFLPPPITILMIQRSIEGKGLDYRWRPLRKISPALAQAAIAGEDARFCEHHGFDFNALEKAMAHNERRPGKIRGGSTISQQTAKNVFLWPARSYVRKGLEAYFTILIEVGWGKRRIMEVYLNVVEWGPGLYGAEAAAQHYFHKSAAKLTRLEASRLTAILPSPLKWRAAKPGPYVQKRSRRIGGAMGTVREEGLATCVR